MNLFEQVSKLASVDELAIPDVTNILSPETVNAIRDIATACFQQNRFWDRAVSELSSKLGCPVAAETLHHEVAHLFPKIADKANELLSAYQEDIAYDATDADNTIYQTPHEVFDQAIENLKGLRVLVINSADLAEDMGDRDAANSIDEVLSDTAGLLSTMLMLRSKLESYGDNLGSFDSAFKEFFKINKVATNLSRMGMMKVAQKLMGV